MSSMISPTRILLPHTTPWKKMIPAAALEPLVIDIVSMTLPLFQEKVMSHLKSGDPANDVYQLALDLHNQHRIKWAASITNHKEQVVKAQISGAADWLKFSNAVYNNYPRGARIELIMDNPNLAAAQDDDIGSTCLRAVISQIQSSASVVGLHEINIVNPLNHQQVMRVKNTDLKEWAQAVIQNDVGVTIQVPPQTSRFVWGPLTGARKRSLQPPYESPQSKRLPAPEFRHSSTESANSIEVLTNSSATRTVVNAPAGPPRIPQAPRSVPPTPQPASPASLRLDRYSMETYLRIALIDHSDNYTQGRLTSLGIHHWSFFRKSSKADLMGLGFPIGIARDLCDGVGRLEQHDDHEYEQEQDNAHLFRNPLAHGTPATPSPLI
ncbi:hypothetical protein PTTG_28685 [Puccinia triticina 1-1 BBBD Race 1]|uniref:Uncharacterized protein n=1 Tax=Puccinia triticina (isolate 1-1 / race 1 (BBBD)) TaxID=630390 RepID=A0A180GAG9_PUCT1|nr:hypothetical protein PTTG_28685 [Puccinia triticina 1-1 BBBD Race 1]